jgi:pimeloyl-ACP methyl ester carboxylesterase
MTTTATTIQEVEVEGLTLAYREAGDGPAVLLLHGWPTSSFLWREIMPPIAQANRVVALDMPGFGASDKPLDTRYGFAFFGRVLDGFLAALEIDRVALGVHDLGGPIGLHWALHRPERVTAVAFLNTLVYPELSEVVLEFVRVLSTPELRENLTSPAGLEEVMKLGLDDEANLTPEVLAGVQEPFTTEDSRRALAAAGIGLELEGFPEIARGLPDLRVPVRIVYGERDRVLPDVGDTMARIARDVPQAEVTRLPCGHFLQEEAPGEVGDLLAAFFARATGGQQA